MAEDLLKYSVAGVSGELKKNVEAWLGQPPETESGRDNFISSASDRTLDALRALGFYRSEVTVDVGKERRVWQVKVSVVTNEPVRIRELDVRVIGDAAEAPIFADILAELPLASRDVFNHGQYEDLKSLLVSAGQKQGYFDGQFTRNRVAVDVAANTADVELHYAPGQRYKFGSLQFDQGQISSEQLSALSSFEAGDNFELARLQGLQGDLQQTG
jgi:translocation and assembly module TamA